MSKKVIISACILGAFCRYDGKTKKIASVLEAFDGYEIIPFCPEAPLFGTPRERISVVAFGDDERIITDEGKKDVTDLLEAEIESFCDKNLEVDAIVLKSKSPSCGSGTTPILDSSGEVVRLGDGVATKIFLKKYAKIEIKDELNFSNI